MKNIHINQAVIIDFDRTIGSVDAAMERLYLAAEGFFIDTKQIKEARLIVENDGGSFDPLRLIQEQLSDSDFEQYLNTYQSMEKPKIMYPDARLFLEELDKEEMYYIVLTYGTNPGWQILKARSAGYKGAIAVVNHTDKGQAIAEHKQADGTYHFMDETNQITFVANTVCLIDDKAAAFNGLPDDCSGFLVKRTDAVQKNQSNKFPETVSIIKSFAELKIKSGNVTRN